MKRFLSTGLAASRRVTVRYSPDKWSVRSEGGIAKVGRSTSILGSVSRRLPFWSDPHQWLEKADPSLGENSNNEGKWLTSINLRSEHLQWKSITIFPICILSISNLTLTFLSRINNLWYSSPINCTNNITFHQLQSIASRFSCSLTKKHFQFDQNRHKCSASIH
jgi:hypothetical protein